MFCNSNHGDIGIKISISSNNGSGGGDGGISSRCLQRIWLNWMWCWFLVLLLFNNCSFLLHSLSVCMRALYVMIFRIPIGSIYLFIIVSYSPAYAFHCVVSFAFHIQKTRTRIHTTCAGWNSVCSIELRCVFSAVHLPASHTHMHIRTSIIKSIKRAQEKTSNHKIVPVVCFICGRFPRVNMSDCSSIAHCTLHLMAYCFVLWKTDFQNAT